MSFEAPLLIIFGELRLSLCDEESLLLVGPSVGPSFNETFIFIDERRLFLSYSSFNDARC